MEDADQILNVSRRLMPRVCANMQQRRREQGRTAQAAFRKRQQKIANVTKYENAQLKKALDVIAQAVRLDDRRELVSAIRDAAEAAGVNVDHLVVAGHTGPDSQQELSLCTSVGNDITNTDWLAYPVIDSQLRMHEGPHTEQPIRPLFKATKCMMWLDPMRYMRINNPPEDIVPYLGANANSLAGTLFWRVLEHAKSQCHHLHHPTTCEAFNQNPCFRRMTDHTMVLRTISHTFLKAMIEARLEYRQLGYITAEYAGAADLDAGTVMHRNIIEDYMMHGRDTTLWLTPMAVEARARSLMGPEGFAMLEAAVKKPEVDTDHTALVAAVEKLVDQFICFGDGPRWNYQIVDEILTQWSADVRRCSLASQL